MWTVYVGCLVSLVGLGYGLRTVLLHRGHGQRPFVPFPVEVASEPFLHIAAFVLSLAECIALAMLPNPSVPYSYHTEFLSALLAAASWFAVACAAVYILVRNDPDLDVPIASLEHARRPVSAHCVLMTRRRMYPFRVWAALQALALCFIGYFYHSNWTAFIQPLPSYIQALSLGRYALALLAGTAASYRLLACSARASSGARAVYEGHEAAHEAWGAEHPHDHLPKPHKPFPEKKLRIAVLTLGTRGDVQPFVGLARKLKEAGHEPVIATTTDFENFVEAHGVEFASLGVGRIKQTEDWVKMTSIDKMMESAMKDLAVDYFPIAEGFAKAAKTPKKADLVICTAITLSFGLDVSEAYDIPCWACKLAPDGITSAFAPGDSKTSSIGTLNLAKHVSYWIRVAKAASRGSDLTALENQFRHSLGLGKVAASRLRDMFYHPVLYGISPSIVPKPIDWPDWFFPTGFLFLDDAPTYSAPAELAEFLKHGKHGEKDPVVCVNFGSMIHASNCGIIARSVEAVIAAGYRCLVISGWSETPPDLQGFSNRVMIIKEAPHDWVFPRCGAIIHHGGAGTAARVAASGVPGIVVPVLKWADQATWGELYARAKVGLIVHAGTSASLEQLKNAVQRALSTTLFHKTAKKVASMLLEEDGCSTVLALLESSLCEQVLTPPEYHSLMKAITTRKPLAKLKLSAKQIMCYKHCLHIREIREQVAAQQC